MTSEEVSALRRNMGPLWLNDSKKGLWVGLLKGPLDSGRSYLFECCPVFLRNAFKFFSKRGTLYGSVLDFTGPIPSGWRHVLVPPGNSLPLNGIVLFYNEWLTLIMGVARRSRIWSTTVGEKVDVFGIRLITGQISWTKPWYNSATRVKAVHLLIEKVL